MFENDVVISIFIRFRLRATLDKSHNVIFKINVSHLNIYIIRPALPIIMPIEICIASPEM